MLTVFSASSAVEIEEGLQANVSVMKRLYIGPYCAVTSVVYKIPYRRARAWPSGCIGQVPLGRVRARAKESCIQ